MLLQIIPKQWQIRSIPATNLEINRFSSMVMAHDALWHMWNSSNLTTKCGAHTAIKICCLFFEPGCLIKLQYSISHQLCTQRFGFGYFVAWLLVQNEPICQRPPSFITSPASKNICKAQVVLQEIHWIDTISFDIFLGVVAKASLDMHMIQFYMNINWHI